jgi:peptidoglycan hydrolase-like protein with peptidoglycan-binding domain
MNETTDHPIGPPIDERSRLPVRAGNRSAALAFNTERERAAYAAGRKIRLLYTSLLVVAAAAGGAWLAGSYIQSPAEMAARVAPPPPSPILVPVEEKVLSADIVTRGTARFGLPQPISLAPSPLKSGPGLTTALPLKNTQLYEGDVILTASGRPIFILEGKVPAYRDLVPGLEGEDVRQLKQSLVRLGYKPGDVDKPYDEQTSEAVATWYRAKGWEPFGPTREQIANIRILERDSTDAIKAQAAAAANFNTSRVAVEAARAAAAHTVKLTAVENAARQQQQSANLSNVGSMTVESERARAKFANSAADAELAAQIAAEALVALDPRQTETARQAASARLDVARAAQEKARLEGEMAVRAAEREASLAGARTEVGRAAERSARLDGDRNIRAAMDAQNLAALDQKITTERSNQIAADLATAKRKLGVQVPIDEVVFVPALPVRVEEVITTVGHAASGTVLTVTDNQLSVDGALPLESAPLVKVRMPVAIDEQALGIKATGVVETVATTPGTFGADGFHIYFSVRVNNTPVPLAGFSVRLTIPIQSTSGPVTAVPVSALSLATDGSSRIQRKTDKGLEYVTVNPGLSSNGFVQVTPVSGRLSKADLIVVGYNNTGRDQQ